MSSHRDRGRCGPSTMSRSTSSMRSSGSTPSAADICAAAARRAAGGVGPGHEMIAAETGLAHHVLEGDVGRTGHRRSSARGRSALSGSRDASSSTARLARSIISFWSRSSSTAKRAGTLASNGNCCSSRVHSAWMVCTFSPPGVSSAQANSLRAALAQACVGMRDAGIADRRIQRVVVERHPMAERGEHPLRHVGGGGLGEGDAEDFFRRHVARAAAGSPAAPAHASCPSRHWPRRRRTPPDRTRAPAWRGRRAGMMRGAFTIPRSPVRRPPTIP